MFLDIKGTLEIIFKLNKRCLRFSWLHCCVLELSTDFKIIRYLAYQMNVSVLKLLVE